MSRMVNTVCGPVSSDKLGIVLAHEHIIFGFPGFQGDMSLNAFNREEMVKQCSEHLADLKMKYGLQTLVEATPNECGRDVRLYKEISEKSGVNIICSTAYFLEAQGAPAYFYSRMDEHDVHNEIYEIFEQEFNRGIEGTEIKAGVVKVCSSLGETTDYEKMFFKAAGKIASNNKDVRIITHTTQGTCAMEQVNLLIESGADPAQIQIGHFGGYLDIEGQKEVLSKGVYVAFDRMGIDGFWGMPEDKWRYKSIMSLIDSGYGDKILLSNDWVMFKYGRKEDAKSPVTDKMKIWNWTHLFEHDLPNLNKLGLSEEQCDMFVKQNPAEFYGGKYIK